MTRSPSRSWPSGAQINRKTFYLHYDSLDELLGELQEELAEHFIRQKVSYRSMEDIRALIRLFLSGRPTCRCSMSG